MALHIAVFAILTVRCGSSAVDSSVSVGVLASDDVCVAGDGACAFNAVQTRKGETGNDERSKNQNPDELNTGGTCSFSDCDTSRKARCQDGQCVCNDGNAAVNGACPDGVGPHDTGGTCDLFDCDASRGATCVNGRCVCKSGNSNNGKCSSSLVETAAEEVEPAKPTMLEQSKKQTPDELNTGGTCSFSDCDTSRKARCQDGQCVCNDGDAAVNGACPDGVGPHDTGGTCDLFDCDASRGATCASGRCVCESGNSNNGKCTSSLVETAAEEVEPAKATMLEQLKKQTPDELNTGGTCGLSDCDTSRKARCQDGQCVCNDGDAAVNGACPDGVGPHDTGGTCDLFDCDASRGATCVNGRCVCESGNSNNGKCSSSLVETAADEVEPAKLTMLQQSTKQTPKELNTGGTCSFSGCDTSRKARCHDGQCVCNDGDAAVNGACPDGVGPHDTGGTCDLFDCDASRGAKCVNARCVCESGNSNNGKCS